MTEEYGLPGSLNRRFGRGRPGEERCCPERYGQDLRALFVRHGYMGHGHEGHGGEGLGNRGQGCRNESAVRHGLQAILSRRHRDVRTILASSLVVHRREGSVRLWCAYREGRWGRVMAAVLCARGRPAQHTAQAAGAAGPGRALWQRPVCHVQSEGPFFDDIPQELFDRLTPPWEWPEAAREHDGEGLEWYMRVCRAREEQEEKEEREETALQAVQATGTVPDSRPVQSA